MMGACIPATVIVATVLIVISFAMLTTTSERMIPLQYVNDEGLV